jgi:hypothetical protein
MWRCSILPRSNRCKGRGHRPKSKREERCIIYTGQVCRTGGQVCPRPGVQRKRQEEVQERQNGDQELER